MASIGDTWGLFQGSWVLMKVSFPHTDLLIEHLAQVGSRNKSVQHII